MVAVSFQIVLGPVETTPEVDSTNAELIRRARAGAPHGLVLVADHQTAGRGRLDRRWEAEPGAALLVSVLLRPALPPAELHRVTAAAALAARDGCVELVAVAPSIKWPNDLLVDGRKLAGILAETLVEDGVVSAVVVGMGLNLRDEGLPDGAIAVAMDRDELLQVWLRRLDDRLDDPALMTEYRNACDTIGRRVRVELHDRVLVGAAVDVDDDGSLLVDVAGIGHAVRTGDVVHLRPDG